MAPESDLDAGPAVIEQAGGLHIGKEAARRVACDALVLYGTAGLSAIEVNHGRSLRPADLRGIKTFQRDYPEATPLPL